MTRGMQKVQAQAKNAVRCAAAGARAQNARARQRASSPFSPAPFSTPSRRALAFALQPQAKNAASKKPTSNLGMAAAAMKYQCPVCLVRRGARDAKRAAPRSAAPRRAATYYDAT
jgi:hypothetical protein